MATSASPPGGRSEADGGAPLASPPAKLRPGRVWYWVSAAVVLAGVAWVVVAFLVIIGQVDSFPRVPAPGTGVLFLPSGGPSCLRLQHCRVDRGRRRSGPCPGAGGNRRCDRGRHYPAHTGQARVVAAAAAELAAACRPPISAQDVTPL